MNMKTGGTRAKGYRWKVSRVAFYLHLWVGVGTAVLILGISLSGILLNHKKPLGLMPRVAHEPGGPFAAALSLNELADRALAAAPREARAEGQPGNPPDLSLIDRMDVRPEDGFVKVRLGDKANTEVILDLSSGEVLEVGRRKDVFLEKLHSGEIFGASFVILSDLAAGGLLLTLVTGYWLWLAPRARRKRRIFPGGEEP